MKTWLKKYEWTSYAACSGNELHTAEHRFIVSDDPSDSPRFALNLFDLQKAKSVCDICKVRPECIEWALQEKACSVVVAGVYLPDPFFKKDLKTAYAELQKSLPIEKKIRGEV